MFTYSVDDAMLRFGYALFKCTPFSCIQMNANAPGYFYPVVQSGDGIERIIKRSAMSIVTRHALPEKPLFVPLPTYGNMYTKYKKNTNRGK
jgi:hypothetical protein